MLLGLLALLLADNRVGLHPDNLAHGLVCW